MHYHSKTNCVPDAGLEDLNDREKYLNFWPRKSFLILNLDNYLLISMLVVGSEKNEPRCLDTEVPDLVKQVLQPIVIESEYDNPKELCTHRFYGGSNYANLGGVCRPQSNGPRKLEYLEELKSPYFTRASRLLGVARLQSLTLSNVLEGYCNSACSCGKRRLRDKLPKAIILGVKALLRTRFKKPKIFGLQQTLPSPKEEMLSNSGKKL